MAKTTLFFFPLLDFYAIFKAQNVFGNKDMGSGKHTSLPNSQNIAILMGKKKFYFSKHIMLSKDCVAADIIRSSRKTVQRTEVFTH